MAHALERAESFVVDGTINITEVCQAADWHLATAIEDLLAAGMTHDDAEAYANYRFALAAAEPDADRYLSDEQFERVT